MVKKKHKTVCFAKIWKPTRQHFGFFEDWQNFDNPQKFGKFLKLEIALILRFLLKDLLLIQTKLCDPGHRPSRDQDIIILIFFFFLSVN